MRAAVLREVNKPLVIEEATLDKLGNDAFTAMKNGEVARRVLVF